MEKMLYIFCILFNRVNLLKNYFKKIKNLWKKTIKIFIKHKNVEIRNLFEKKEFVKNCLLDF